MKNYLYVGKAMSENGTQEIYVKSIDDVTRVEFTTGVVPNTEPEERLDLVYLYKADRTCEVMNADNIIILKEGDAAENIVYKGKWLAENKA